MSEGSAGVRRRRRTRQMGGDASVWGLGEGLKHTRLMIMMLLMYRSPDCLRHGKIYITTSAQVIVLQVTCVPV